MRDLGDARSLHLPVVSQESTLPSGRRDLLPCAEERGLLDILSGLRRLDFLLGRLPILHDRLIGHSRRCSLGTPLP